MKNALLAFLLLLVAVPLRAQQAAFPGAQGGGALAQGGRGGVVYEITTLNDTPGPCTATAVGFTNCSYRQCYVNGTGPRNCIFRVAGIVQVTAGDMRTFNPFVTVSGQSAPGEVILGGPNTNGMVGGVSTHDVIFRYVVMSPDNFSTASGPDSGTTSVDIVNCSSITQSLPPAPPTTSGCYNIILDHVTLRWSGNKSWITTSNFTPTSTVAGVGPNHNLTVQWTLDYEPHEGHPVGWGTATDESCVSSVAAGHCLSEYESNIDFHHDILINVDHRIPEIGNFSTRWVSNIIYNWSTYAMQELGAMTLDIINSKYIKGPLNAGANPHPTHWSANGPEICGPPSGYMAGNIFGPSGDNTVNANQWGDLAVATNGESAQNETDPNVALCPQATNTPGIPVPSAWQRSNPMPASNGFPITADAATTLDTVLLPTIGNSQHLDCLGNWVSHRDPQDKRIINQYQTGGAGGFWPNGVTFTGSPNIPPPTANWTDTPVINGTLCTESLHDGIPDQWKVAKGLSTTDVTVYKTIAPNGDTWLNNYLNGGGAVSGGGGGTNTPLTITNITVTNITSTSATINWTTSNPANSIVNYGICSSLMPTPTNPANVTMHSVALAGLTPSTIYTFNVESFDGTTTLTSPNSIFTTLASTGGNPTVPTPPVALALSAPLQAFQLQWTASTTAGVTSYKIYRSPTSGTGYVLKAQVTGTIWVDTAVAAGQTLYYVVTAVCPGCTTQESAFSNQIVAVIP